MNSGNRNIRTQQEMNQSEREKKETKNGTADAKQVFRCFRYKVRTDNLYFSIVN
jgi:hypothetical protein